MTDSEELRRLHDELGQAADLLMTSTRRASALKDRLWAFQLLAVVAQLLEVSDDVTRTILSSE